MAAPTPIPIDDAKLDPPSPNHSHDESDDDFDNPFTLRDVRKTFTKTLDLRHNYAGHWKDADAFRELCQNWWDAILKAFSLLPEKLKVKSDETKSDDTTEILHTVWHADECLGYIRFSSKAGEGFVEMTNRESRLELEHLDFGPNGKQYDDNLAGEHGDGMKVALLVLMRFPQSHIIRFYASGFTWNFSWRGKPRKLSVNLVKMTPKSQRTISKASEQAAAKGLVPFAASPLQDVQIFIGLEGHRLDERGLRARRCPVSIQSFARWCQVASWLQRPSEADVVGTGAGSLFLDGRLRGNIYLKGLLIRGSDGDGNETRKRLKYGYDVRHGSVNRDRQAFSSPEEEARAILAIWNEVIRKAPEHVDKLNEMVLQENSPADANGFEGGLNRRTAAKLWEHLRRGEKWYYNRRQRDEQPQLDETIARLGYKGQELPKAYWALLRKHTGIKTVDEEQSERFNNSMPVAPDDPFSLHVFGTIRACLASCEHTKDAASVQLVRAGHLPISIHYNTAAKGFKIHDKCARLHHCILDLKLPARTTRSDVLFHTVKQLFDEALDLAADPKKLTAAARKRARVHIGQKLLAYCRLQDGLALSAVEGTPNALKLEWPGSTTSMYRGRIAVQLHRESICSDLKKYRFTRELDRPMRCRTGLPGGCIAASLPSSSSSHLFNGLQSGDRYFAILFDDATADGFSVASESRTPLATLQATPGPAPALKGPAKLPGYRNASQLLGL